MGKRIHVLMLVELWFTLISVGTIESYVIYQEISFRL